MPHTYYIDSATGNNANAGTSTSTPFKSLTALNNLALNPGDTVLLARGTSYADQLTVKHSGASGSPITFGAYGEGAAPVIKGPATGVYSSGTHDVVVHDIAITDTSGYAVLGRNLSNWTVDDIAVSGAGSSTHPGSVSFENSSNIIVENSTISGVTGDGMLINGGKGITVENNKVGTVQGHDADNVQINNATNVKVLGNQLDMSGTTDSTKGNLVVNSADGVDIEHNTMAGGKYGASVNSNNVTIASNDIHGQGGYDWSFGVGIGENWNVKNYNIHDNNIHDVATGVALSGTSMTVQRDNIDVHDNTFDHNSDAALRVDRPATGEFTNNEVGTGTQATDITSWIAAENTFKVSGTTTFDASAPTAHPDVASVSSGATQVSGDVLANDKSASGGTLSVSQFDGHTVGSGASASGEYGVVSIDANGNFVYHVDAAAVAGLDHQVSDTFSYVVTDGHSEATSKLEVDLAPTTHVQLQAVNDGFSVGSNGAATGNVLANDVHAAGDTLHLRSIGSVKVGSSGVHVVGHYGTLSVDADGSFSYAADAHKIAGSDAVLHDTFTYKMSNGAVQDTASVGIDIDTHMLSQASSDFHM